jgi:hypothetical protein
MRLQRVGVSLDIEEQLTQPCPPLRAVLLEKLWGLRSYPSTYLLDQQSDSGRIFGLAQVKTRPGQLERDIVFMSPKLDAGNGGYAIWQRLLTHLCVSTAEKGGLRIFARLPDQSNELQLFKSVGFAEFSQEEIFRLDPAVKHSTGKQLPLRPQQAHDSWGLQKLYATLTPHPVQNAEGLGQGRWSLPKHVFGKPGKHLGYVWEVDGELLSVVHIRIGKCGCWIRTLLHPDAYDQVEDLGRTALSLVEAPLHLPVYFSMRQYQAGWLNVLPRLGFQPLTSQKLVVKNMVVQAHKTKTKTITASMPVLQEATIGSQSSAVSSQNANYCNETWVSSSTYNLE